MLPIELRLFAQGESIPKKRGGELADWLVYLYFFLRTDDLGSFGLSHFWPSSPMLFAVPCQKKKDPNPSQVICSLPANQIILKILLPLPNPRPAGRPAGCPAANATNTNATCIDCGKDINRSKV